MSIASEITRLQTAKNAIKNSIAAKGVAVPGSARTDTFPGYIDAIPVGNVNVLGAKGIGALVRVAEGAVNCNYLIAGIGTHGEGAVTLIRQRLYGTSLTNATSSAFAQSGSTYTGSTIDTLCNTTIFNKFSATVQNRILSINIPFAIGSTVYTIPRKCFLLSRAEVLGTGSDGTLLPWFAANDNRSRQMLDNSSTVAGKDWWLRSLSSATQAYYIVSTGQTSISIFANNYGVLPAFVMPADTPVSSTMNADGSVNIL